MMNLFIEKTNTLSPIKFVPQSGCFRLPNSLYFFTPTWF